MECRGLNREGQGTRGKVMAEKNGMACKLEGLNYFINLLMNVNVIIIESVGGRAE